MSARIRINDRGLKKLQAPGSDVDRAVRRAAELAAARAHKYLRQSSYREGRPSRFTFKVRRSTATPTGRVRYSVAAHATGREGADLAMIYEKGSKPHKIEAVRAPALVFQHRWTQGRKVIVPKGGVSARSGNTGAFRAGNVVIVRKGYVNHPGTKPIRYMEKAFRDVHRRDFRG